MLKEIFYSLCLEYSSNSNTIDKLFKEIEINYSSSLRYYHTLKHLENMLEEMANLDISKNNSTVFKFALFYHDIIYNPSSKDNEKKSAQLAKLSLIKLNVPTDIVNSVYDLILLTSSHQKTNNYLYKLFLDADLSILGSCKSTYKEYIKNIRKEYKIYSDNDYFEGRKKVLVSFLNKECIFQTAHFRNLYEKQAKINILNELNLINTQT